MLKSVERLKRWRRAAHIIESFQDIAIAAIDPGERFTYINSAAVRLLRHPADEIIGRTIQQVFTAGDAAIISGHFQTAFSRRVPLHFEEHLPGLNARYKFECFPIKNNMAFHFSDITETESQESEANKQELLRPLPLWEDDCEFMDIFARIEYTLVDHARCYILFQFAKQAAELHGDVAEVGVYKGGTAKLLALTFLPRAKKTVHLFDTFEGMPPAEAEKDHHREGDLGDTSLEAVQRQLQDCDNVQLYKGRFPDTAGAIENSRFCMVHIDADIYRSVKDSCEFFYPRLERGGIMVFDDYGFISCPGARKAVDEFFSDKAELPVYLPSGQCVVMRK